MLHELTVENFILIESLTMAFDPRLNILSGETGAGKSILIDAMGFVLGKKPDKSLIRMGHERAAVQATFLLSGLQETLLSEDFGIRSDEGLLIIHRELFSSGRSTARINGLIVTSGVLEGVGELLVDFHGQHAHQSLLHPKNHLTMLDAHGGPALQNAALELQKTVAALNALEKTLEAYGSDRGALSRRLDGLNHEITEITAAQLTVGEDDALEETFETLRHMEDIIRTLQTVDQILNAEDVEGLPVLKGLSEVVRRLGQVSAHNSEVRQYEASFSELYHQCADLTQEVSRCADRLYFDEERYRQVSDRLDLINTLKRKYAPDLDAILEHLEILQKEAEELSAAQDMLDRHDVQKGLLLKRYQEQAEALSAARREKAAAFVEALLKELKALNLPHARLQFQFDRRRDPWQSGIHRDGADQIELMISMNAGEPLKPLKSVASGGELSRLMLALKIVQANGDAVGTLVFDEIDSGISGKTASVVGEKLIEVSGTHQVLCISHLAQICALGDRHFLIEKHADGAGTTTDVIPLAEDGRRNEIARILGGAQITTAGINASEELIQAGIRLQSQRNAAVR